MMTVAVVELVAVFHTILLPAGEGTLCHRISIEISESDIWRLLGLSMSSWPLVHVV